MTMRALDQSLAQCERVVPRAERDHAVEINARRAEPAESTRWRVATCHTDAPSGRDYDMPLPIDGGRHRSPEQLDPMCRSNRRPGPVRLIPLAEEQSLGQRWALVRQVLFRANRQNLAIEAPLTQADCRGSTAKRGTDDDNARRS